MTKNNFMRTNVIKLFVLFMALLPGFSQVNASASSYNDDEIQPITIEKGTGLSKPPRSIIPECYYLNGCVYIICDSSITSISATVTRLSDNAQWSGSNMYNTLRLAVSSDADTYRLEFSLSDGSTYYGEFTL